MPSVAHDSVLGLERNSQKPQVRFTTRTLGMLLAVIALGACATLPRGQTPDASPQAMQAKAQGAIAHGDAALHKGDLDRALFEYLKALELDGKNIEARYKIAVVNGLRGKLDLSEQTFRQAMKLDENHPGVREGLGLVLLRKGQNAAAAEQLERAIALDPSRWRAHNALGLIGDFAKDHGGALAHYQAALKIRPDSPMLLNNLGYSHYLAGDRKAAKRYYHRALEQDPEHGKTWSNLGLLYTRLGQYQKALDAFERVMARREALNNIGYICLLDGRHADATTYLRRAIEVSPQYYPTAEANLERLNRLFSQNPGDASAGDDGVDPDLTPRD